MNQLLISGVFCGDLLIFCAWGETKSVATCTRSLDSVLRYQFYTQALLHWSAFNPIFFESRVSIHVTIWLFNIAKWKIPKVNGGLVCWENHLFLWAMASSSLCQITKGHFIFSNDLRCSLTWILFLSVTGETRLSIPFLLSNYAGFPRFITTFDQDLREPRTLHLTRLGWNPGVQKTSLDNWDFEMFIS